MEVTLKQLLLEIEQKWEIPSLNDEEDSIRSAAEEFELSVKEIIAKFPTGQLRLLPKKVWETLQNTDSTNTYSFYDVVNVIQKHQKKDPSYEKDWQDIKDGYKDDFKKMDAPIVIKRGKDYILLAGNARLMVAKAMGITPFVYLFSI